MQSRSSIKRGRNTATGLLRVTSTFAFARRRLAPLPREFRQLHPDLQIHLEATDSFVNLVESGYDLAIRFGALADSSLVARQLAPNVRVICAAPAYLERHGRPATIEDLLNHDCIIYGNPPLDHWCFADGSSVRVKGTLSTNDGEAAHAWALEGAGLGPKSTWDVEQDIAAGRLEVVLPALQLPAAPIHAVYLHRRHTAARVRLCVEFLAKKLQTWTATAEPQAAVVEKSQE